MTKTELIEKISGKYEIPETEQKLFFEMLLLRLFEELQQTDNVYIPDTGRFEYRKAFDENENDYLVFISKDDEELIFNIPETEEASSSEPVDSYFSISIGKPVIPFKGARDEEIFVPYSGNEIKRFLELKIEKLIEDAPEPDVEIEGTNDLDDIRFSFLNWKKSTDINEEINEIEKELDDSFSEGKDIEDESELIEINLISEEEVENISDEIIEETISGSANDSDEIEDSEDEEEIFETSGEWADEVINETDSIEEDFSENIESEIAGSFAEKNEPENHTTVEEVFKYAEERKTRLDNLNKRSKAGYIFAAVIILFVAGIFYFSTQNADTTVSALNKQREFDVTVERSNDIPISNSSSAGISDEVYESINDDVLKQADDSSPETNNIAEGKTSPDPEIRDAEPTKRIKGYIYQYNDGTYAAQVSSWKSKSIALSETKKFLEAGYNAFVEQTESAGKTYYRVRVGGFASLSEAENFLNK